MTFLQVGSCGSALLLDALVDGNRHGFFVSLFTIHTHTFFVFFGAWGCSMATCDSSVIATILGNHI